MGTQSTACVGRKWLDDLRGALEERRITYGVIRRRGTYEVIEDLVANDARHFEALLAGDRVNDHVAMDADEVFRVEDAVLILCIVSSV